MHIADIFERVAGAVPADRPAVICDSVSVSWSALAAHISSLSSALRRRGLREGDTVGLYMRNSADYIVAFVGCAAAGLVPFNINYRYGASEVDYLLRNADARGVIADAAFAETLNASAFAQEIAVRVIAGSQLSGLRIEDLYQEPFESFSLARSEQDIFLLYTGGTTGLPKGVMWPYSTLWAAIASARVDPLTGQPVRTLDELGQFIDRQTSPPVFYIAPPLMHGTGLFAAISVLILGGTIVCSRSPGFNARDTLRALVSHRCTGLVIVGDAFARPLLEVLDEEPGAFDVSGVTAVVSSGMIWSDATKRGLLGHMPSATLSDGLGASEASGIAFSVVNRDTVGASAGFSPVDAVVLNPETLRPVQAGEIGVIAKRGALPLGYFKDPEKTARTYPTIDGVRYMIGGDFARIEPDGTITLLGRGSNCINTAGEKVFVEEVETALKAFPLVRDALVFGEPDHRFGERVVALVETSAAVGEDRLVRHVQSLLAAYKAPRQIRFAKRIPRGPNGKPDYGEAKRLFREARVQESQPGPDDSIGRL